jgi:hypothetical protein
MEYSSIERLQVRGEIFEKVSKFLGAVNDIQ